MSFPRRFFTIAEMSNYLGVHPATIRDWVNTKRLPNESVIRISGEGKGKKGGRRDCLRFDLKVIEKWIETRRQSNK